MRWGDNTRSAKAKQLDNGIANTFVSDDAKWGLGLFAIFDDWPLTCRRRYGHTFVQLLDVCVAGLNLGC